MISHILSAFFIFFVSSIVFAQKAETDNPCFQKQSARLEFIKKADSNSFLFRRTNFTGNKTMKDRFFREKLAFREGDVFSARLLDKSILNFNKLKQIKPITIKNVLVKIDSQNRDVELLFCVEEKPRLN